MNIHVWATQEELGLLTALLDELEQEKRLKYQVAGKSIEAGRSNDENRTPLHRQRIAVQLMAKSG